MIISNMIKISRIFVYIMSMVLLISTIKTKNKIICRNNFIASIFSIFYFCFSVIFIPEFFDIEIGWDILPALLFSTISSIISIITIIIANRKIKKNELEIKTNSLIKSYLIIFMIIPIFIVSIAVVREIYLINNSNMIIKFNYQNGMISSEDTIYAVGNDFCRKVSIEDDDYIFKHSRESDYYTYDVKFDELNNRYFIESYNDENLEFVDTKIFEQLFNDIILEEDEKNLHNAYIYKIDGTNYYIVSHYIASDENSSGGTVKAEYIYDGIRRIDEINCRGTIDEIDIYK